MKLGATATSPGVTARWVRHRREPRGFASLSGFGNVVNGSRGWVAWAGWRVIGAFPHRWQAKRAVEDAVSQALREAGEQ